VQPIQATKVRYLKLGRGGQWESECLQKGIARFGFGSSSPKRLPLCREGRWEDLKKSFTDEDKDSGTATRFTNETRLFFEDDGSVLWITFVGETLYWGFLSPEQSEPHPDGHGVFRKLIGGWSGTDISGDKLIKNRLPGALTKVAAYRGTSCEVEMAKYVVDRINGKKAPQVERAVAALEATKSSILEMVRLLHPRDFEILVDLVFSTSGWRRMGNVGGPQKMLDIDLFLPSTRERAFVQVKSKTIQAELDAYVEGKEASGHYDRMFYVYHSGDVQTDDEHVTVIGPKELPTLVIDAGLVNWLIDRVL